MDFFTITTFIWQVFSMLFVLYKFTSFFTVMYDFFKFLTKLFNGLVYINNRLFGYLYSNYITINNNNDSSDIESQEQPKTFYQSIKDKCTNLYNYFFDKSKNNINNNIRRNNINNINNINRHNNVTTYFENCDIESSSTSTELDVFESQNNTSISMSRSTYPPNYTRNYNESINESDELTNLLNSSDTYSI